MIPTQQVAESEMPSGIYALAASPEFAHDGICFAASQGGLFRSEDGGATWRPAYGGIAVTGPVPTTVVAVPPAFPGDRTVFAGVEGGILRSLDGGHAWSSASLSEPSLRLRPIVSALEISPDFERDGVLFAGTMEDGVFRSADRGASWVAWNFGLLDLNVLCLAVSPDFANDETLVAATESGLFVSTNGGRAWR